MRRPAALFLVLALAFGAPAAASEYRLGPLRIEQPWSRATPGGATVGVGYLEIVNTGAQGDRLVGAESPVAARVTLHRSVEQDGTTRMEAQHEGIEIPARGRVGLRPGGLHLMLMRLGQALEKGGRVPVTLRFERAGAIEIELEVRAITAGTE